MTTRWAKRPLNMDAVKKANQAVWAEMEKPRKLTMGPEDEELRTLWMDTYLDEGGKAIQLEIGEIKGVGSEIGQPVTECQPKVGDLIVFAMTYDGTPLGDVWVLVDGPEVRKARTFDNGFFYFQELLAGAYDIWGINEWDDTDVTAATAVAPMGVTIYDLKFPRNSEELLRDLDNADVLMEKDLALEIVGGLEHEELEKLSTSKKALLAEVLTSGEMSEEDEKALRKLYRSLTKTDWLPPSEKARKKDFELKVKNDKELQEAKMNWEKLSEEDRKKAIQKAADHHSDAFGMPRKEITYKDLGSMNNYGYYSSSDDKVVLNDHKDSNGKGILDNPSDAFDTAAHENTHRYQDDLNNSLNDGAIDESDDRYDQARLMRTNKDNYTRSEDDYNAYRSQPMEQHAWDVGTAAR